MVVGVSVLLSGFHRFCVNVINFACCSLVWVIVWLPRRRVTLKYVTCIKIRAVFGLIFRNYIVGGRCFLSLGSM